MNIYLPAILVSPGYEPFDPYPYWPEIYILNIFFVGFWNWSNLSYNMIKQHILDLFRARFVP